MSEFTKEELIEIHRCLKYITKGGVTPYSTFTIDLMHKIHAMIDSYCDQLLVRGKCFDCGALQEY